MSETIFDQQILEAKNRRALMRSGGDTFLWRLLADDIADRMADIRRDFSRILLLGPAGWHQPRILPAEAQGDRHVARAHWPMVVRHLPQWDSVENGLLPYDPESFDLVISFGWLDTVERLPEMLFQIRHVLRPDGLFLGSLFGAGSLATLRHVMQEAEGARPQAHFHPQITTQAMAALIQEAGFAMPVIDSDWINLRYGRLDRLLADIRDCGIGNALSRQAKFPGKAVWQHMHGLWQDRAVGQVRVDVAFHIININGWSPSPDQPKAARRGSAQMSLAEALKRTKESE